MRTNLSPFNAAVKDYTIALSQSQAVFELFLMNFQGFASGNNSFMMKSAHCTLVCRLVSTWAL